MDDMETFLKKSKPTLWAKKQGRGFLKKSLYVTLYKDMYAKGYNTLEHAIKSMYKVSVRSLRHNVKVLRRHLHQWGRSKITRGNLSDWERAASGVKRQKYTKNVVLTMDSTDFRLAGKSTTKKSSEDWSYKLNGPGQRFHCIQDLRGKIIELSDAGYTPKLYDGHWMLANADRINRQYKGSTIAADCHYHSSRYAFENLTILAPAPDRKATRAEGSEGTGTVLSKKQQTENAQIRALRSRVEAPFGIIKTKFEALFQPWYESKKQQNHMVNYAVGVHNFEL